MRKPVFLLMCLPPLFSCKGQDGIKMPLNMFHNGDIIVNKQISFNDIAQKGTDVVWDISNADVLSKQFKVKYSDVAGSNHRMACTERATMYYYDLQTDSLLVGGFENNTTKIDYDLKEIYLRFPMKYGDSYSGVFHGTGMYCDKIAIRSFGRYKVEADAYGTLISPECDTLYNVTRLHTIRLVCGLRYPADSLQAISSTPLNADSIDMYINNGMFMMRTDIYRWYAEGYRYPVLETQTTSLHGADTEPYVTTYYYPPSAQELTDYPGADGVPKAYTPLKNSGRGSNNCSLACNISKIEQERINIEFSLPASAEISYGIYTADGKTVYANEKRKMREGIHHASIDISSCRSGVYILRIDADGDSHTEKITIKR